MIVIKNGFGELVFDSGATVPCTSTPATIVHPFAASFSGSVPYINPVVTTCNGGRLAVIKLKTGVAYPTEPAFAIQVTVKVSELADPGVPLRILARGGFEFGANPTGAPGNAVLFSGNYGPCDTIMFFGPAWFHYAEVKPTVFQVRKNYLGPEGETATGPNNLQYYSLTVDVAEGQTIQSLRIQDRFPNNVVFANAVQVWPNPVAGAPSPDFYTGSPLPGFSANSPMQGGTCAGGADYEITRWPTPAGNPTASPDNELEISLCHPITGR